MMRLSSSEIKPLMSEYIKHGYKKDDVVISSLEIFDRSIVANIDVENYFMPTDGQYHFTALHTELCVIQMLIIYTCSTLEMTKKPGEAYLREFQMKMKRKINKTKNICIHVEIEKFKMIKKNVFVKGKFDVEERSFYGEICGILPLESYS